ncbi:unnamed protein product [Closterium sp. NIES-54]
MDVWGPARVSGEGRERYFLLVVDDYTRYTRVFPLHSKGEVPDVLIPWIRAVRLQLHERFRTDLPVLCLHYDRGGEFSSDLLRDFSRGEGILQSFTLPASPQKNGIAERRIGSVMEVTRTSMIHVAAPHFLWPFAVRYAAHQLSLWPRVSLLETSPTLHWTGEVGNASVFRVWGSRAFVRDTSADKLSARAIPGVFLGFPPDAPGWQFYHPTSCRVFPSQDVTFDKSVPFIISSPTTLPLPHPRRSSLLQVPLRYTPSRPRVAVASGAARGAAFGGAASGGAEPGAGGRRGDVRPPGGAEPEGVEPGGAESGGAGSGGAEPRGTASFGVELPELETLPLETLELEVLELLILEVLELLLQLVVPKVLQLLVLEVLVPRVLELPGLVVLGVLVLEELELETLRSLALELETIRLLALELETLEQLTLELEVLELGVLCLAVLVLCLSSSTVLPPSFLSLPPHPSQPQLQPGSPLPAPSPYADKTDSLTECREPESRLASPIRAVRTGCRDPRPRPPPVPDTQAMTLRPSSVPLGVPLLPPPESSLPAVPDLLCCICPHAELADFATARRLDYATALVAESESSSPPSVEGECALGTDVLEERQEDFECLAAAVPYLMAMLLAPEGDPDAPDIPTPRSYAEAIPGFCQRQGVDYFQTFSPTPKMTTLRVLLHVAAQRDYELHSLDFSTAFLQGNVHKEIWLRRPPGFTGSFPAGTQWSLRRPVYGLRQVPREWHDTMRTTLAALGFNPSTADPSLFLHADKLLPPFYVLLYVDDLVFATADTEALTLVKSEMQKRHTCTDLGELRSYLGLQITRDRA